MPAARIQQSTRVSWIEMRAAGISDPVERLKYLRRCAADQHSVNSAQMPRIARLLVSASLWAFLLWPNAAPTALNKDGLPVPPAARPRPESESIPPVWHVETRDGIEFYSNGLQIQTALTVPGPPRSSYPVFRMNSRDTAVGIEWRQEPAGIVFHSSESHQAPFERSETANLVRIGRGLIDYVRHHRSYHYVIDRFGRVWRIVPESDVAFHAGYSVWGEPAAVFVNLNSSFLGVALESEGGALPTEAQEHATRVLTQWLRSRYRIPAANCVAHGMVSVNPDNMRLGYHTDWAAGFPFLRIGLPDNYDRPSPAVYLFGFTYDNLLLQASRGSWPGLVKSEDMLRTAALAAGCRDGEYKQRLFRRYRSILKTAGQLRSAEENET